METAAEPVFIGIDVSKQKLDVAVLPSGEAFAVERNEKGLVARKAALLFRLFLDWRCEDLFGHDAHVVEEE